MLRFLALGRIELFHDDGRRADSVLTQSKRLALLTYLLVEHPGGRQRRDTLLGMFWPELDESRARHALSQSLHVLRRALGPGVITRNGDDEVGVDPTRVECDAVALQAAVDAGESERVLELYGGELLPGLQVTGAPEFERWMSAERERLRRSAAEAARDLALAEARKGEPEAAMSAARRLLEIAPHDEEGLSLLMTALAASGRRAEAVQAYEVFADRLRSELELEPSPEVRACVEGLRARKRDGSGSMASGSATRSSARLAGGGSPGRPDVVRPISMVVAGIVVVTLVAVAILAPIGSETDMALHPDRVIVEIFQNRSGEPALDPIGPMAADWITQGLSRTGLVEVIDPATALLLSDEIGDLNLDGPLRLRTLAEAARAGIVISGSFYSVGDSILFQARIADVAEAKLHAAVGPIATLSAQPLAGVERLRARILGGLAMRLDPRLASLTTPSDPPPTYAAYREYIRGLDISLGGDALDAVPHFARAAELDTTFTLPLVWMMWGYYNRGRPALGDSVLHLLAESEERLGRLDRYSLEYWRAADIDGRLRVARRAAELAPASNWTYNVGFLAVRTGRPQLAIDALRTLHPDRGWVRDQAAYWLVLSRAHHLRGDHEEELAVLASASDRHPNRLRSLRTRRIEALAALGRLEELTRLIDGSAAHAADPLQRRRELSRIAGWELLAHGHSDAAESMLRAVAASWTATVPIEPELTTFDFPPIGTDMVADTAAGHQQMRLMALVHDLAMVGRLDEARAVAEQLISRPDAIQHIMAEEVRSHQVLFTNVLNHADLGVIAALQGDVVEAERILAWLIDAPATEWTRWANYFHAARVAARLGRAHEAVQLIRVAIGANKDNTVHNLYHQAHQHPDFSSLRGYPPFQELMQRTD